MLTITLYTKEGCHLCQPVKEMLPRFQTRYPHQLVEVDISQDKQLYEQFRYAIPVLQIGQQQLAAPITAGQLETAFDTHFTGEKKL